MFSLQLISILLTLTWSTSHGNLADLGCKPVLNLSSFFQRPNNPKGAQNSAYQAGMAFAFPVGDIDLPILNAESSMGSAMRLWSTFNGDMDSEAGSNDQPINVVKFRNNQLYVDGLNLSMLNVHLYLDRDPRFALGFNIKNTTLTGSFQYHGALPIISDSNIRGFYRMSIGNILLLVSSNLTRRQDNSSRDLLKSDGLSVNITNLGYINIDISDTENTSQPSSNYLLKVLQRVLQRTIKRTYYSFESQIRESLQAESQRSIDCELQALVPSPISIKNEQLENQGSHLSRIINAEIHRQQISKVGLSDFSYQQNVLGSPASVYFYNGSIGGLNNIVLTGDTLVKLQDDHLLINSSLGWDFLTPEYNWSLHLGKNQTRSEQPTVKGHVYFRIKRINFRTMISKGMNKDDQVAVDHFQIEHLESPEMHIGGLPGMNRFTSAAVNFFMGRLKKRLASSIEPVLRQQLERALNSMDIFA